MTTNSQDLGIYYICAAKGLTRAKLWQIILAGDEEAL